MVKCFILDSNPSMKYHDTIGHISWENLVNEASLNKFLSIIIIILTIKKIKFKILLTTERV